MKTRAKDRFRADPFTDLLFNALLGFTFLFLVAIMFMNPKARTGVIDPKAEYILMEKDIAQIGEFKRPDDSFNRFEAQKRGVKSADIDFYDLPEPLSPEK